MRGGGWIFVPVLLLVLGGLAMNGALPRPRRRVAVAAAGMAGAGVIAVAGVSMAQQSSPTTTPLESLPVPARIFATSDPQVVAPVASRTDDPRRDRGAPDRGRRLPRPLPRRRAREHHLRLRDHVQGRSGWPAGAAGSCACCARLPLALAACRPARRVRVSKVRLGQPARVLVRIRRKGRTVRVLRDACLAPGSKLLTSRWDGRVTRRGKLRRAAAGRYRAQVLVRSDRKTVSRSAVVVVRKRR